MMSSCVGIKQLFKLLPQLSVMKWSEMKLLVELEITIMTFYTTYARQVMINLVLCVSYITIKLEKIIFN